MRELIIFTEKEAVKMLRGEQITLRTGTNNYIFSVENTTSPEELSKLLDEHKKTPNQIRSMCGLGPVQEPYVWSYEYIPGKALPSDILTFFDIVSAVGLTIHEDNKTNAFGRKFLDVRCATQIELNMLKLIYSCYAKYGVPERNLVDEESNT